MKHSAFAIALLTTVACFDDHRAVDKISYVKDKRTGLCFAGKALGSQSGVITHVPCTPEVERIIK